MEVKTLTNGGFLPFFLVFDILRLEDKTLDNLKLSERKAILADVIEPVEGKIELSKCTTVNCEKEALEALESALKDGQEGIMLKDPVSGYAFNSRTSGWIKVKPDYLDGVMSELDLLIVGVYLNADGYFSTFLCAARIEDRFKVSFLNNENRC